MVFCISMKRLKQPWIVKKLNYIELLGNYLIYVSSFLGNGKNLPSFRFISICTSSFSHLKGVNKSLNMLHPSSHSQHEFSMLIAWLLCITWCPEFHHCSWKLDGSLFVGTAADDDLGSNASILEGSDDDDLDQLLRTPNSDIVSSRDKTLTPGRDSL